jgi:hypothetical protein
LCTIYKFVHTLINLFMTIDQLKIIFLWSDGVKYNTHNFYKFQNCIYLYRNFFSQKYWDLFFWKKSRTYFLKKYWNFFLKKYQILFSEKNSEMLFITLFRKKFPKKDRNFFLGKNSIIIFIWTRTFFPRKIKNFFSDYFFHKKRSEIFFQKKLRNCIYPKSKLFSEKNWNFFPKKDRKVFSRKKSRTFAKKDRKHFF